MAEHIRIALMDGRHDEAWALYAALHASGKAGAEAHLLGGRAAIARGDWYAGRTALERSLAAGAQGETLGQVRLILGDVLRRVGEFQAAVTVLESLIDDWEQYTSLGPEWLAAAHYNMGLAYREADMLPEAIEAYETVIRLCEDAGLRRLQGMALRNLSWAQCLSGNLDAGARALDDANRYQTCPEDDWHQRVGYALWASLAGQHLAAVPQASRIAADITAPPEVRAQACWICARSALQGDMLDMAASYIDHALVLALECSDPRVHRDAARLQQEIRLAKHKAAGA